MFAHLGRWGRGSTRGRSEVGRMCVWRAYRLLLLLLHARHSSGVVSIAWLSNYVSVKTRTKPHLTCKTVRGSACPKPTASWGTEPSVRVFGFCGHNYFQPVTSSIRSNERRTSTNTVKTCKVLCTKRNQMCESMHVLQHTVFVYCSLQCHKGCKHMIWSLTGWLPCHLCICFLLSITMMPADSFWSGVCFSPKWLLHHVLEHIQNLCFPHAFTFNYIVHLGSNNISFYLKNVSSLKHKLCFKRLTPWRGI